MMASEDDPPSKSPVPYGTEPLSRLATSLNELEHPSQIGNYRILGMIGRGGMGNVYKAEQSQPIKRIVAIKVVRPGMDTRDVIGRFEAERQALALMDHPNVARVIEAGATDAGRPYFAMEYVDGEPITDFADRLQLTIPDRLHLFTQVCHAIEHAHQKAIIHRDLKPSNILVTMEQGKPWVKVIDFGVAKALEMRLTESTMLTDPGGMVGTLEYMAPEQADGRTQDVDTRTDVYSLGVVLYELLTGAVPFDSKTLRTVGLLELRRIICKENPPRPSTRFASLAERKEAIASNRRVKPAALTMNLRRELDWIPLKATRKLPDDRYSSPTQLLHDIENHLAKRPLIARPDSRSYQLKKFVERNIVVVTAAAAVIICLVAGIIATSMMAIRATRAERSVRAEQERTLQQKRQVEIANANTQAVNAFLTDDLLAAANPAVTRGQELTVRAALDLAAKAVAAKFHDRPLLEASVQHTLGRTYLSVGRADLGIAHASAALEHRRKQLGPDHGDTIESLVSVAEILSAQGRFADAEPISREAVELCVRVYGPDNTHTLTAVAVRANNLQRHGKFSDAEALYERAIEISRRCYGDDSLETFRAMGNLGTARMDAGRLRDAEPLLRASLAGRAAKLGRDHPITLTSMNNLANALERLDKRDEAEALYVEALAMSRRVLGNDHPETTEQITNLGNFYSESKRFAEAEALLRESLATSRRVLGENHMQTAAAMNNLAFLLHEVGSFVEAESLFRDVLERCKVLMGADHPYALGSMNNLANLLFEQGRYADAEPLYADVYHKTPTIQHEPKWKARYMSGWGICLTKLNRFPEAEPALLEAHRRLTDAGGLRTKEMRGVLGALVEVAENTSRPDEAARWRTQLAAAQPASTQSTTPPASGPTR